MAAPASVEATLAAAITQMEADATLRKVSACVSMGVLMC